MRVFAENPNRLLDEFSAEFERGYLETLSHRHGTKRVPANRVYQEYIADKQHAHMNATIWTTLTGFCMHLGREGKAIVDETEKGWFIQFIDRDPQMLARQRQMEERKQFEQDEEIRRERQMEAQIEAAEEAMRRKASEDVSNAPAMSHDLDRDALDGKKIALAVSFSSSVLIKRKHQVTGFASIDDEDDDAKGAEAEGSHLGDECKLVQMKPKLSFLPNASKHVTSGVMKDTTTLTAQSSTGLPIGKPLTETDRCRSEDKTHVSYALSPHVSDWLYRGMIVKMMSKCLEGGRYNKEKGEVIKVDQRYKEAEIKFSDNNVVRIPQRDLETVVPKPGGRLIVVNGYARGLLGTLLEIHTDKYNCDIRVEEGEWKGQIIRGVDYEDISKFVR